MHLYDYDVYRLVNMATTHQILTGHQTGIQLIYLNYVGKKWV